ncbi:amidohydrolase family protein [Aquimarina sp. 2-A2]|uniref:amidohydrolase family protein n=1 Tax=Aquimarina sp. 2-A2 TaxID=3382644 RepID=UPI00387EFE0D
MKIILTLVSFLITAHIGLQSQNTIIQNIKIIDVKTGDISEPLNILIAGDKIVEISKKVHSTKGVSKVVDGTDTFAIPGLIDTHIHFFQTGGLYTRPDALDLTHIYSYRKEIERAKKLIPDHFKRYLRLGITSVMDLGGPFYNFKIRDSLSKDTLAPNVFVTGPLFSPYQPKAFSQLDDIPIEKITSINDANALFDKMLSYKPDFIKIWYIANKDHPAEDTFEIVNHIAKRTHDNKLKLAVHATDLSTAKLAVKAGADILVHSIRDEIIPKDFIEALKANNVTYIPTLLVSKNYISTFFSELPHHSQDLTFANPELYNTLSDLQKIEASQTPERLKKVLPNKKNIYHRYEQSDSIQALNLKLLSDNDVAIATGSDAGNIGTMHASSYIQEAELMKKSGLSAFEILKASTYNAAKAFGLEDKIGSIATGKIADLVLLSKNPLDDITNLNSITEVIKSGVPLNILNTYQETPSQIVQRQVNAYNARNIEAFMATYSDDIKIFNFPEEISINGKDELRQRFSQLFEKVPNLYCEIKNRIVLGNKVVDREHVRFNERYSDVIAIYELTNNKISKVTFLRQ